MSTQPCPNGGAGFYRLEVIANRCHARCCCGWASAFHKTKLESVAEWTEHRDRGAKLLDVR